MQLKPYPTYKPAGVPWLQQVPEHWDVRRIKTLVREMESRSKDGKELLMSLSKSKGLVPQTELGGKAPSAKTHVGYKICEPDQIVMNRMQAWNGLFGLAKQHGMVSPDYAVFNILEDHHPYFLQQVFRTPIVVEQFANASKGIGSGFNRLYTDKFGAIAVPVAPPEEQHLIVRYLHALDAKVKHYIRTKRTLIARLQEQKQAIIQQAVTRGLDPNVKLKPSGVEWLGEVPEHWEVQSFGNGLSLLQTGPFGSQLHAEDYRAGGIPVINPSHILGRSIVPDVQVAVSPETASRLKRHHIKAGDIVAARRGEIGRCALAGVENEGWICGTGSVRLTPVPSLFNAEYLVYLLTSSGVREHLLLTSIGATMNNLNSGALARMRVPRPSVYEQMGIVTFIDAELQRCDTAIANASKGISCMIEYHTRLIADVVTGAVDVRAAAKAMAVDAEDQTIEEEPLSMAAEEEAEYGEDTEL